jgi:hypothetical protein
MMIGRSMRNVPEPRHAIDRNGRCMTIKVAIWAVADCPTACVAGLHGSAIRITSGAGDSVDVVRLRRDWSCSSHRPRACWT